MKQLIAAVFAAVIMTLCSSAHADEISVYLNNSPVEFDQPPIIYDDLTFVPFRAIFEKFAMVVQWHDDDKRATAFNHNYNISFVMDFDYIFLDGIGTKIPHGPIIVNSRMLVPLRALVEGINGDIYWDANTQSVYIYSDEAVDDSDWTNEILRLTNEVRAQYGLNALLPSEELSEVGREHCIDMAARRYFDHTNLNGESPFDRMRSAGITMIYAGENIAAGQINPEDVMNAWINSPEHMENILTPEFTYMGAAMYRGGDYGIYWAQEFIG